MNRYVAFLILLGAVSGCTSSSTEPAPTTVYSIDGHVTDAYGDAIPGISVTVTSASATTDDGGYYALIGLPAGTYNMTFQGGDWVTRGYVCTVGPSSQEVDVALARIRHVSVPLSDTNALYMRYASNGTTLYADNNYGSATRLTVDSWQSLTGTFAGIAYFGFDFDVIPGDAEIHHATFTVSRTDTVGATYSLNQILGPWDEYALTYNNRPGVAASSLLPVTVPMLASQSTVEIDVTAWISAILAGTQLDYGLAIVGEDPGHFNSRESQTGRLPALVVECVF